MRDERLMQPFASLFLDGRGEHGAELTTVLPTGIDEGEIVALLKDDAVLRERIYCDAEQLGFHNCSTVIAVFSYEGDYFTEEISDIWAYVEIDIGLTAMIHGTAEEQRQELEGLEEAAQICDGMAGTEAHAGTLAAMIRALKEKSDG